MKTKTLSEWLYGHPQILSYRTCFYVLLLLAAWHVLGDGLVWVRLKEELTSTDNKFDSFSEPQVAAAILRQRISNLANSCTTQHELTRYAALNSIRQQHPNTSAPDSQLLTTETTRNSSVTNDPSLKEMLRLNSQIRDLQTDLDLKLMAILYQTGKSGQLLDCYLEVLQEEPENPALPAWSGAAVEAAKNCHRMSELIDALQDVVRFHPELKAAPAFQDLLHSWGHDNLLTVD